MDIAIRKYNFIQQLSKVDEIVLKKAGKSITGKHEKRRLG
jgi:hypothetical protein